MMGTSNCYYESPCEIATQSQFQTPGVLSVGGDGSSIGHVQVVVYAGPALREELPREDAQFRPGVNGVPHPGDAVCDQSAARVGSAVVSRR
jgi:hypothetical protein